MDSKKLTKRKKQADKPVTLNVLKRYFLPKGWF